MDIIKWQNPKYSKKILTTVNIKMTIHFYEQKILMRITQDTHSSHSISYI